MTGVSQPSYVRRALVEPEPPPLAGGDALTWTRARLFDGVFNTVLTIVSGVIIAAVVWPTVKFLFIDAVWTGTSRVDCLPETVGREVGACWPFVRAKFTQFMYGFLSGKRTVAGQSDLRARRDPAGSSAHSARAP